MSQGIRKGYASSTSFVFIYISALLLIVRSTFQPPLICIGDKRRRALNQGVLHPPVEFDADIANKPSPSVLFDHFSLTSRRTKRAFPLVPIPLFVLFPAVSSQQGRTCVTRENSVVIYDGCISFSFSLLLFN